MDAAAVQIDQWSDDASFIFCRLIHMEGDGFLSDILLNGVANEVDGDLAGFDDLDIPMTQETQHGDVEEVQASRSTKGSKRTKKFSGRTKKLRHVGHQFSICQAQIANYWRRPLFSLGIWF